MVATLGKPASRAARLFYGVVFALLWVIAVGPFSNASAQTSMQKRQAMRANSPFNLSSGVNAVLQANLVQCGLNNSGDVCTDVFDSPTGGGGYWPSGTTNQYIFNSGLQIAGVNGTGAGAWSNDTVGAFFFDARGTQKQGTPLTDIFVSSNPNDLANWPEGAIISDTSIYNAALIGAKAISDQDSYVEYWDGDPNRLSGRTHPMGIKVQQRSLAFNAPAGAENTIFFIYRFTNVTNDPSFQQASEAKFGIQLPDAGWTINQIYAAFSMDPDVTTHAGNNFSTAMLPLNMGVAYHATFQTDDFNFNARADLYAPPFFQGPGFVGVKYLRSPVNPVTKQQVGLTMFSNTTNGGTFPDPVGVKQLFRYLKGDVSTAAGDPVCTISNAIPSRLCALVQAQADTRFFESSGPFSLAAGESAVIVVGYTHGAPVRVSGYAPGTEVRPGVPSRTPGAPGDSLRLVEKIMGMIQMPQSALVTDANGIVTGVDETKLVPGRDFVQKSLIHNALIAQSIFNNKFLLPRPPESPQFSLVPGDNQVTVVWAPSATETCSATSGGDPFFIIAGDPTSPLYNPNYRRCDVEGYRIYRATGLSGGFELIAEFDKIGTFITDVTCELNPEFVPEEGEECEASNVELNGDVVMFVEGGRVRNAVTGSVALLPGGADTISLGDTGVPFAYVDRTVRNGITYRYIVTAFDVNSLKSGSISLESPRAPQFVTPRKDPNNIVFAELQSSVTNSAGQALPSIPNATINSTTGIFSGPQPPTNGLDASFAPVVERLLPAFNLKATIDSVTLGSEFTAGGCPNGSNAVGACWRAYMTFERDGAKTSSVRAGYTPAWYQFGEPLEVEFPMGSGVVQPDPAVAAQFGLPSAFPGFTANVIGQFGQSIQYSQMEGHFNRRSLAGSEIYPGFAFDQGRFVPGGSRWYSGANETVTDPTALIKVGRVTGADSIFAPIHHTPVGRTGADISGSGTFVSSTHMQCFPYAASQFGRAADVKITWGANGAITSVVDVTHNTPVIFKPTVQVSYGFLNTDGNGNGVIDWEDFDRVNNIGPVLAGIGFCDPQAGQGGVVLANAPTLNDVSFAGGCAHNDGFCGGSTAFPVTGKGFGLYINGERYLFTLTGGAFPASGTVWTLRTYTGLVRAPTNALTNDPSGYSFRGDLLPRQPMVTGLTFNASAPVGTGPEGEVDITHVHTVPDPYYVRSAFELGPSNKALRFVNLPPQAIIRIYTLNGTLVRVLEHNDPLGGAEAQWDLRNRNNQFVASGVYFFVVEAAGGKKFTGKFTVVQFAR